jgi:hypothetical protein
MTPQDLDPRTLPKTPDGYRAAWALIEQAWTVTVEHAKALPPHLLTERVNGEWSFIETLRHLIFATDSWVRRTIMSMPGAYYPGGLPHDEAANEDGIDVSTWGIDVIAAPSLDEVLEMRPARMADVRQVLDALEFEDLNRLCAPNPALGNPEDTQLPIGECLDVVIEEEWGHHGYATRDLALLAE